MKKDIEPHYDDTLQSILNCQGYSCFKHVRENLPSGHEIYVTKNKNNYLIVEPLTMSWVALALVEGALSALGAKIFKDFFDKGVNLYQLQEETFLRIEQIIGEAISQDSLRRCGARIDAITTLMQQYNNAPDTSLDRLYNASTESVSLVAECKSLRTKAILPFCTAVGIQISILQERLQRFGEQGERQNIIQLCQVSHDYIINEIIPELRNWSDSRFGVLRKSPIMDGSQFFVWVYTFGNRNYEASKIRAWPNLEGEQEGLVKRQKHMDEEWELVLRELSGSTWEVAMNWKSIKEKYESNYGVKNN